MNRSLSAQLSQNIRRHWSHDQFRCAMKLTLRGSADRGVRLDTSHRGDVMTRGLSALFVVLTLITSPYAYCQDASQPEEATQLLLDMLSRMQTADATQLEIFAERLRKIPQENVQQGLRIKAAGMIGQRLMELDKVDAGVAQLREAISLPHAQGAESLGCANMWSVPMDFLAYHYHNSGQADRIIPTFDEYATHSTSLCFRAKFASLRGKWLKYTGRDEESKNYIHDSVRDLLPPESNVTEYELTPLFNLVCDLGYRDRKLREAKLHQIATIAESFIRGGGSLGPFFVFVNCRLRLCGDTVEEADGEIDLTRFKAGVEELARIAKRHAAGDNAAAVRDRIDLICSRFDTQLHKLNAKLAPHELIGKTVPELQGTWITPARADALKKLRGEVIVLDFWAIWCGPCVASFPHVQRLQDEHQGDGLVVIGVTNWYGYSWDEKANEAVRIDEDVDRAELESGDHAGETLAIRRFLQSHGVEFAQLVVDRAAEADFAIEALPTLVIVDRKGIVRKVLSGRSEAVHANVRRTVRSLLNE